MSDFDGIDKGTTSRLSAFNADPITVESLTKAMNEMQARAPTAPCGSEKRPHLTPPAKLGEPTRCVTCGEQLVYTSENRGIALKPFNIFERTPLRLADVPESEYRWRPVLDARVRRGHAYFGLDDGFDRISAGYPRLPRRWRQRNLTRSTKRTDFGALWPR